MFPELKTLHFDQLVNYMTGYALMRLGQGDSLRSIVAEIMRITLEWKRDTNPS